MKAIRQAILIFLGFISFGYSQETGTVTDIDGNTYKTVKIGDQWWMAENLKVTHYQNGDAIPNVKDNNIWYTLTTGAYCEYDNNINYVDVYGRLYNWYALNDSRNIAPLGWHVASDEEWKELEINLGMSRAEANAEHHRGNGIGGKIKMTGDIETGTGLWFSPNFGATNESGFSALPGGSRGYEGRYEALNSTAIFWTSTERVRAPDRAWRRSLNFVNS